MQAKPIMIKHGGKQATGTNNNAGFGASGLVGLRVLLGVD